MGNTMTRILVIDDDDSVRDILSKALIDFGWQVRDATDGEEGIELLKDNGQYKVVITDICMPKKDGNDVAKYVKGSINLKDVLVVGVTGMIEKAEKELFDYLIPKPFKIMDIVQIIGKLENSKWTIPPQVSGASVAI